MTTLQPGQCVRHGTLYEQDREGRYRPVPNTLPRRQHGQCPYCQHYGTDCHCHKRKTMPAPAYRPTVYLVLEQEPDCTEFPSVVLGVYQTKAAAEARIAYERTDPRKAAKEADEDLSWEIEAQEVWP